MNLNIRFKGFEGSNKVKDYIEVRSKKLDKFLPPNTVINATLEDEKTRKIVEFNLRHKGTEFVSSQATDNLFTSIDEAVDKLARQLNRAKSKNTTHSSESVKHMPEIEEEEAEL